MANQPGQIGMGSAEDSSDEEEETMASEHKFGEPLTRTKAQDGFVNRGGGFDTFADRVEGDDEGNTVDRVSEDITLAAGWRRLDVVAGEKRGFADETQYWRTVGAEAGRRPVDSSDEEDDDADWLRPSVQRRESDDDDFGVSIAIDRLGGARLSNADGLGFQR